MARIKNKAVKRSLKAIKKRRISDGEKMEEAEQKPYKFFNLKRAAVATGIDQYKVYNNFKGEYTSLTPEENKRIATALMMPTREVFARLGMIVSFTKIPDIEPLQNAG
jgi:hypothetical protein